MESKNIVTAIEINHPDTEGYTDTAGEEVQDDFNDVLEERRDELCNDLTIQGTIVSIQTNAKFSKVQIITDDNRGKSIPEIIFYNPSVIRPFGPKSRVLVKGYCQTRINKVNDNAIFETVLVGISMEKADRALKNHIPSEHMSEKEGGFGKDINTVFCIGLFNNVIKINDATSILIMECVFGISKRYVEFFCFQRQSEYVRKLNKGDIIAVCGSVRTNQDKVGIRNMKQDIVCNDITIYI